MKGAGKVLVMTVMAGIAFALLTSCAAGMVRSRRERDYFTADDGTIVPGRIVGSVRVLASVLLGAENARQDYFHETASATGCRGTGFREPRTIMNFVSGPDSRISSEGAEAQVPRIARARGVSEERVRVLVEAATESPSPGFIGRDSVNVLKLNLSLDEAAAR